MYITYNLRALVENSIMGMPKSTSLNCRPCGITAMLGTGGGGGRKGAINGGGGGAKGLTGTIVGTAVGNDEN